MSRLGRHMAWFTVGILLVSVCAINTAVADTKDLAQLKAQLASQEAQLAALQQQVAARSAQDTNAARADMMRQQIREILGEQEFRESLMPSMMQAGYDNGFFIRSSDDKFLMKVNALAQFRWTHYGTRSDNRYLLPRQERDDRTGFDMQRLRICFSGHAYSEDLTYLLELRTDAANSYDAILSWAYIDYRLCDSVRFRFGKFKGASTRANTTAHHNLQMISRPMVDAVFGAGFVLGARMHGQLFENKVDYYLDVVNSLSQGENFGGGRTITADPAELDGNPAILFRVVWHALAENNAKDFVSQSDIERHESLAFDLGFHYLFNDDAGDLQTTRIPFPRRTILEGGWGLTNTNGLQIHQMGLDAAFKYQGFSAIGEYIIRMVDPRRAGRTPFAPWWLLTGDDSSTAQHGAYVQAGYFLPIPGHENKIEAVARVGAISALAEDQECTWEYGAGLNYYLEGNNVKLMTDVIKYSEVPITSSYKSMANVNDDALIWRVQLQVAF
ncbi:MAG: porin [Planctomycetota bacterium]